MDALTLKLDTLYNKITYIYKQQFDTEPPKYFKYIVIAFGGLSVYVFRIIFWKLLNKLRNYPPGPIGAPFLGCLLQFGGTPRKFLVNVATKYGPITYVPLMTSNNIFVNDVKILRKLYLDEKINERPPVTNRRIPEFISTNGHKWNKRRKYAATTVFNLTNTSFILSHVKKAIANIEPEINKNNIQNKQLWYPSDDIYYIALNNVFSAVFDHVLPRNDPFIKQFSEFADESIQASGVVILMELMFNYSIKLPNWIKNKLIWNMMDDADERIINWMKNNGFTVNRKQNELYRTNQNSSKQVYVDLLISKMNEKEIDIEEFLSDVQVILAAGIDTTSKSTEYGFALLIKYPDIQARIYEELQSVMKKQGFEEFNFKILNELHIFRAFIHETLRIAAVVPTGLPHMTTKKHIIDIDGKTMVIPKKTMIHQNTYFMQKYLDWNDGNKVLTKENNEIHLEYWLNEQGKFKKNENFVLFGVGKRDCVGQGLALKAMYAMFGLMINKYKFIPESDNQVNIQQKWGLILGINPPIGIRVQRR